MKKEETRTEKDKRQKETRDKYCDTFLGRTGWLLTGKEAPDWPAKQAYTKKMIRDNEVWM